MDDSRTGAQQSKHPRCSPAQFWLQVGDVSGALNIARQMVELGTGSKRAKQVLQTAGGPAHLWTQLVAAAPGPGDAWPEASEVQLLLQQHQTQRLLPLVRAEGAGTAGTAAALPGSTAACASDRLGVPANSLMTVRGQQHAVLQLKQLEWGHFAEQVDYGS